MTSIFSDQNVDRVTDQDTPHVELITPTDPTQRGCQLSAMFSVPVTEVFQALQKRGVVVCTFLTKCTQQIFIYKFTSMEYEVGRKAVVIPLFCGIPSFKFLSTLLGYFEDCIVVPFRQH